MLKLKQFIYLVIIGTVYLLGTQSANAQEQEKLDQASITLSKCTVIRPEVAITEIPRLNYIKHLHTSVKDWLAQQQNQVIFVTGVSLNAK